MGEALPGPGDTVALIPPTARAFVRRVPRENLWVWYRATEAQVAIVGLSANPPVPVSE